LQWFVVAVARFDFSLGDIGYHQETLENLKMAVKSTKKLCAVSLPSLHFHSHSSPYYYLAELRMCAMQLSLFL